MKFTSSPIAEGFARPDGRIGIRNRILVFYTAPCSEHVAREIARCFQQQDMEVDVIGFYECCIDERHRQIMYRYVAHQNVGGVLAVGHGCEQLQAAELAREAGLAGKASAWFNVLDAGGTAKSIEKGRNIVENLLHQIKNPEMKPIHIGDLSIGAECGGSDFTSGLAANALVGRFMDGLIDSGGVGMFAEMYEAIGLKDYLLGRCADENAKREIGGCYDKYLGLSADSGQFSISPGNIQGGLTSIEEKSMGAVVKSGSRPIRGVLRPGGHPRCKGLWFMDGGFGGDHIMDRSSGDAVECFLFLSCGAHMTFLTSGRGHLTNNPIGPIVKITGNARSYKKMDDDFDVNAGLLLSGDKTLDQMNDELLDLVAAIAGGQKTKGEKNRHFEF